MDPAWTMPPSRMQLPVVYALLAASSALAALHRIDHTNTALITYQPSVCDLDCTRVCRNQWWISCLANGAASHRTKGNRTEASFTFQGSSITWYTRTSPDGGKAVVYIDGANPVSIDTASPVTNDADPKFSRTGLDPSKTHTISVVYDVNAFTDSVERFVDVRYFEYDDSGSAGGIAAPGSTASPSSSTTRSSSGATTTTGPSSSGSLTNTNTNTTSSTSSTGSLINLGLSSGTSAVPGAAVSIAGQSPAVGNASAGGEGGGGGGGTGVPVSALVGFSLGIVIVGALIALGWWWRRRRRRAVSKRFTESKEQINRDPDLAVHPASRHSTDVDSMQHYEMRIPEKLRRQQSSAPPYNADPFASVNSLGGGGLAGPFSSRRNNVVHQNPTHEFDNNNGYDQPSSSSNVGSGTMNTPSSPTTDNNAPRTPIQTDTHAHHGHDIWPAANQESIWPSPSPSPQENPTPTSATAVEKRAMTTTSVSPFDSLDTTATSTGIEYLAPDRRRAVERSSMGTSYRTPTPPPVYVR